MSVMHILFFLHESLFCTKGRSGQNDIFHLCSDDKDRFQFHLLSDLSKRGSTSCLYLSPFLFKLERLQPNMLFTSPVSPLTVGVGLTFCRGPVADAPWFVFIQTLYAKWLSERFLLSPRCAGFLPCQRWPQSFVLNVRDAPKGTFSLYLTQTEGPVSPWASVCVCVCVQKPSVEKKKKRGTVVSCMYDNFFQERCISVLICGNLIIPVCIFLLILKKKQHFLVPNIQLKDADSTTTMMQRFKKKQKADHLLPS